jgi:hypothetical protein
MSFPSIFNYAPTAANVLIKQAQSAEVGTAEEKESPALRPTFGDKMRTVVPLALAGGAGAALGYGAGRGFGHLADATAKHKGWNAAPIVVAGGAAVLAGLAQRAYAQHKDVEKEEMQRALENRLHQRASQSSRK